ncbi:hypothetical protein [Geodermatophilus sp. SYSU D01105]
MSTHCPDCLTAVMPRKPSKDGRCDLCRAQVGGRHSYQPIRRRQSTEGFDLLLLAEQPDDPQPTPAPKPTNHVHN